MSNDCVVWVSHIKLQPKGNFLSLHFFPTFFFYYFFDFSEIFLFVNTVLAACGKISKITATRNLPYFAIVKFETKEAANKAINQYSSFPIRNTPIKIEKSRKSIKTKTNFKKLKKK